MSYDMTGLPGYWFGLPTVSNRPPPRSERVGRIEAEGVIRPTPLGLGKIALNGWSAYDASRKVTMGEAILSVLQLIGLFTGKWLLPRVSGGRLILMPRDAPSEPFRVAPYKRLPNGQIGVDVLFFATLAALFYLIVIVGLFCLFL